MLWGYPVLFMDLPKEIQKALAVGYPMDLYVIGLRESSIHTDPEHILLRIKSCKSDYDVAFLIIWLDQYAIDGSPKPLLDCHPHLCPLLSFSDF